MEQVTLVSVAAKAAAKRYYEKFLEDNKHGFLNARTQWMESDFLAGYMKACQHQHAAGMNTPSVQQVHEVVANVLNLKTRDDVVGEVLEERVRQESKWGQQNHAPAYYLMILGEEVGEANKAALECHFKYEGADTDYSKYRMELIQVAAVAIAMVECIDRKKWA